MLLAPSTLLEIGAQHKAWLDRRMLSSLSRAGFVAVLDTELPVSHSLENMYPAANTVRKFILNKFKLAVSKALMF